VNLTPEQVTERRKQLEDLLKARGRKLEEVEIVVANVKPVKLDEDMLKRYRDAGVSELISGPSLRGPQDDVDKAMEDLARRLLEPAARMG